MTSLAYHITQKQQNFVEEKEQSDEIEGTQAYKWTHYGNHKKL